MSFELQATDGVARAGVLHTKRGAIETPVFMPVKMFETPLPATMTTHPAPSPPPGRSASGLIEIDLGNGRQVRVGSDVNLAALRRVLAALRG